MSSRLFPPGTFCHFIRGDEYGFSLRVIKIPKVDPAAICLGHDFQGGPHCRKPGYALCRSITKVYWCIKDTDLIMSEGVVREFVMQEVLE